jgi:hypothetical protein
MLAASLLPARLARQRPRSNRQAALRDGSRQPHPPNRRNLGPAGRPAGTTRTAGLQASDAGVPAVCQDREPDPSSAPMPMAPGGLMVTSVSLGSNSKPGRSAASMRAQSASVPAAGLLLGVMHDALEAFS